MFLTKNKYLNANTIKLLANICKASIQSRFPDIVLKTFRITYMRPFDTKSMCKKLVLIINYVLKTLITCNEYF